jgi:hypothetical protein
MSFGSDFSALDDLDPALTFLSGPEGERLAFKQAIARRFTTPRFGLFYDPTYGLDLRGYLSDTESKETVETMAAAEARKDQRVRDAIVTISEQRAADNSLTWFVAIKVVPQDGPTFDMTMTVDAVTVELLG